MMLLRAFRVLEVIIYMQMLPILMFGGMRSFLLNFPADEAGATVRGRIVQVLSICDGRQRDRLTGI